MGTVLQGADGNPPVMVVFSTTLCTRPRTPRRKIPTLASALRHRLDGGFFGFRAGKTPRPRVGRLRRRSSTGNDEVDESEGTRLTLVTGYTGALGRCGNGAVMEGEELQYLGI